jgi:hypothetical protein
MSKPKVRVRVHNEQKVINEIKRDLQRGMEKSARNIAKTGREKALSIINENQAYFNYDVAKGFKIIQGKGTTTHVSAKLVNEAKHAGALDEGVPASSYADGGPPVQALLPWVVEKMQGWTLSDSGGDEGGGGNNPQPSDVIDSEKTEAESPEIVSEERFEYEKTGFERDIPASALSRGDVVDFRGDGVGGRYVVTKIYGNSIDATNYRGTINANLDQKVFGGGYQNVHEYGRVGTVLDPDISVGDTVYNKNGKIGTVNVLDSDEIIVSFEDDVGSYENAIRRPTNDLSLANPQDVIDDETNDFDIASQLSSITLEGTQTDGLDSDTAEALLRQFDKVIRRHNFPPPSKIVTDDTITTIDGAVRPGGDSSELRIASNLIEPGGFIDGIEDANEDAFSDDYRRAYVALRDRSGAEYALLHQYGEYLFENLSDDSKAYLAERSNDIDLDSDGNLVPSDESVENIWKRYSKISESGLQSYFGENFAAYMMDDNDAYRENRLTRGSRFFEVALADPDRHFTIDVPDDWDRPDYYIGRDYDADPVRESDLPDGYSLSLDQNFDDISDFTRNEKFIIQTGDGELVEARVFERLRAREHSLERREDLVRLDAVDTDRDDKFYYYGGGESFSIVGQETKNYEFSTIDRGDFVILEVEGGRYEDDSIHFARVSNNPGYDETVGAYIGEGTDLVTGESLQLDRNSFVGRRETNLDEWLSDVDTLEDTPDSEIPKDLTSDFDQEHVDLSFRYAHESPDEDGPIIYIKSTTSEDVYPARVTGGRSGYIDFESTEVDEFGNTQEWRYYYDDDGDSTATVYAVSQNYETFRSLEKEDDIVIDPSLLDINDNPFPEDTLSRATVDSDFNGIFARPWGTTGRAVRIDHEAFVDVRDNIQTWDAYNIEKGNGVEFTVNGQTHSGIISRAPFSDKRYQISEYKVYDQTANTQTYIDARDITSYDDSDFTSDYEEAPNFLIDGTDYISPPDDPEQAEKGDEYLVWSYREGEFVVVRVERVSDVLGEANFEVIDGENKPYKWTGTDIEYEGSLFPVAPLGRKEE